MGTSSFGHHACCIDIVRLKETIGSRLKLITYTETLINADEEHDKIESRSLIRVQLYPSHIIKNKTKYMFIISKQLGYQTILNMYKDLYHCLCCYMI